jgi:hypothetical protein
MFHDRAGTPSQGCPIVLFKVGVGGLEQLGAGNDDDIEPAAVGRVTLSKYLPNQSFSAISSDGVPQFFRRNDAQAGFTSRSSRDDHCQEPPPAALAVIENALVFRSPPEPAALLEPPVGYRPALRAWIHDVYGRRGWQLGRGNREALASLGAPALEYLAPLFRAHTHEESMSARAALSIRLERTLHVSNPLARTKRPSKKLK